MKFDKMKRKPLIVIVAIIVAAIWIQSFLPSEISSQESGWLTEHIFRPVAEWLGINSISKLAVRKLAHMTEFFVLGLLSTALWKRKVIYSVQICFLVAFLDESIQLLSNRGSEVLDVWIDLCGAIIGIGLSAVIAFIRKRKIWREGDINIYEVEKNVKKTTER